MPGINKTNKTTMTEIGKRMCQELSPAAPVAKKTKGPDSEEETSSDKQKSDPEPIKKAPGGDKSDEKTSTCVNFILSIPVEGDEVREIIVQFSSEDVAFNQSDYRFDDMIEFIDEILAKKYGGGVHVNDTSIEIYSHTEEKADGVWEEAAPKAK